MEKLVHQMQILGLAVILDDTFCPRMNLVFKSTVGRCCVLEPGTILMGGRVADHRYVPAGSVIKTQADALPEITSEYPLREMNHGVVHVNKVLAKGYLEASR